MAFGNRNLARNSVLRKSVGVRISKATGGAYAEMADVIQSELAKIREESADRYSADRYSDAATKASDISSQASEKASDLYTRASEKVGEVAQTARDTAARQTSTVKAAIDAGKKAYQQEKRKTELSGRIEAAPEYTEKSN